MRLLLSVMITSLLLAQTPPASTTKGHSPTDQKALTDLWVLLYKHQSQNTAFQASLTDEQKKMMASLNAITAEVEKQKSKVCGEKEDLDLSNPQAPLCKEAK